MLDIDSSNRRHLDTIRCAVRHSSVQALYNSKDVSEKYERTRQLFGSLRQRKDFAPFDVCLPVTPHTSALLRDLDTTAQHHTQGPHAFLALLSREPSFATVPTPLFVRTTFSISNLNNPFLLMLCILPLISRSSFARLHCESSSPDCSVFICDCLLPVFADLDGHLQPNFCMLKRSYSL